MHNPQELEFVLQLAGYRLEVPLDVLVLFRGCEAFTLVGVVPPSKLPVQLPSGLMRRRDAPGGSFAGGPERSIVNEDARVDIVRPHRVVGLLPERHQGRDEHHRPRTSL